MTQPIYPIANIPHFKEHQALQNLFDFCSKDGVRIGLIGFNECAKHLVNLCGDAIIGFHDPAEWKTGITFRGKPVVSDTERLDITHLAVCDYLLAYDYADRIATFYGDAVRLHIPPRFGERPTQKIDPFTQEQIYKDIFAQADSAPLTMMTRQKLCFLMELLRYSLRLPGDVIEVGSWQGGSAWYLAKILSWNKEERHLYIVDPFEMHATSNTATMCNDEIERALAFYPGVKMLVGRANEKAILAKLSTCSYCFAHFDLTLQAEACKHIWDRLAPGAPFVLDNYGLTGAHPGRFERFFADRGCRIIRLPWSEQGVVFKHTS
ncbi:TylF/MycF family methyltransferase [Methylocystis sp. WRRC1]|uniref:TylF/MycF/NovP-related O-methyltransferase n=1 Tax=Methylocystis sp. WRRC1 TaxID=1732014 RepID=UPI001D15732E|nr:TylF/MycF/NovP-related O-methyltransferase [Methylocystis sp. WRRC1]MCC3244393.1 TylF/MycF family methyltransferase [Methylocystis sp. WRRC1]